MRCVFLGPPGAGKGTQAAVLREKRSLAHISTGDILRDNVKKGTDLGKKAKEFMDSGGLVPDEVIVSMMKGRLQEPDCSNGFILDGFPRTAPQAEALGALLNEMQIPLDAVILFDASDDVVIQRLTGRRICRSCGAIFHAVNKPPKVDNICDACGGELYQRDDDSEDVVKKRLEVYKEQTRPLVDYYEKRGILVRVDAGKSGEEVISSIESAVGSEHDLA